MQHDIPGQGKRNPALRKELIKWIKRKIREIRTIRTIREIRTIRTIMIKLLKKIKRKLKRGYTRKGVVRTTTQTDTASRKGNHPDITRATEEKGS
jgi:hypothetical protein